MSAKVSIIICTRDRVDHLKKTLESLAKVHVPGDMTAELIIVDNGSKDRTGEFMQTYSASNMPVRYILEPMPGKSRALNTAMQMAEGEIFLHSDDDVRFPQDWIEQMCRPIVNGWADAVIGSIRMAVHLTRPWMTRQHRDYLVDFDFTKGGGLLVGANQAFSRQVFAKIGGFDSHIGPGAMGLYEDVLFSWQTQAAGFRVVSATDGTIEHHFDPSRLKRGSLLEHAKKEGRSMAYVYYHYLQTPLWLNRLKRLILGAQLLVFRMAHPRQSSSQEGCSPCELKLMQQIWFQHQLFHEAKSPRRYPAIQAKNLIPSSPQSIQKTPAK